MEKFSIENIQKIPSLADELEYEKASSLYLQLRVLIKNNKSYQPIRDHLRNLIKTYKENNWANKNLITDEQIKESDLAEAIVASENRFNQNVKMTGTISLKQKLYN